MKIENYLNTKENKTREQLIKETRLTDRKIRSKIAELKKKTVVLFNSQTKGYRLAKELRDMNTEEEIRREAKEIEHCLNDMRARRDSYNEQEELYNKKLSEMYLKINQNKKRRE